MTGPQFLGIYALIALLANWWLRRHYRSREAEATVSRLDFSSDPYQIALLRKGDQEAVDVVIFSLVDRGLLKEVDGQVCVARPDAMELVRRPIEKAVLESFADWGVPAKALQHAGVRRACQEYGKSLTRDRLLADANTFAQRQPAFLVALALIAGIAGARIVNALLHGRHNIGFLIILAVVCAGFLVAAYRKRLTGLGEATLERLQRLFARLKARAAGVAAGGASHEAALLAALFGLSVLPASTFPYVPRLFKKSSKDGGSDGGGGSCDGGGCGGGGCGGGCGG